MTRIINTTPLKLVFAYNAHDKTSADFYNTLASSAPNFLDIAPVSLSTEDYASPLTWPELDSRWRARDPKLLDRYRTLIRACAGADAMLAVNGVNVHPGVLQYLGTFNAYMFNDDPEDSPWQSRILSPNFDGVFYGNISAGFQYESWGCKNAVWHPIFTVDSHFPCKEQVDSLFAKQRDIPIILGCGLDSYASYRGERLRRLSGNFPEAECYGRGWQRGLVSESTLHDLYRRTRIGWNIHRTTGPINRRMFALAAHGVLQICDNKTGLGKIFKLNEEVVGFDTIDEAIELTRYYLLHEDERLEIAKGGFARYWRDYSTTAWWNRLYQQLIQWGVEPGVSRTHRSNRKIPGRNLSSITQTSVNALKHAASRSLLAVRAAKREYAKKEQWWKIYDRVFTCETVYLSQDYTTPPSKPSEAERVRYEHLSPQQRAVRWALTQLVGSAKRMLISDPMPAFLVDLLSVDAPRELNILDLNDEDAETTYDLNISVDVANEETNLINHIKYVSTKATKGVYAFPGRKVEEVSTGRDFNGMTFGEAYWLLRNYYARVRLLRMPSPVVPWLEPADINSIGEYVVAVAEK